MLLRDLYLLKVCSPIDVKDAGRFMFSSEEQSPKVQLSIEVTNIGRMTPTSDV